MLNTSNLLKLIIYLKKSCKKIPNPVIIMDPLQKIIDDHRNQFYEIISQKADCMRKVFFQKDVDSIISTLRDLKNNPNTQTQRGYYLLNHFQILEISNYSKLI